MDNNNPADSLFNNNTSNVAQQQTQSQQPSEGQQQIANPADALFVGQPAVPQQDLGWFMAGVDGFNRQFEKMAIGSMQLASYLIPNTQGFRDNLNYINKYGSTNGAVLGDENATKSLNQYPEAYALGAGLGTVGSAIAYGGPLNAANKYLAAKEGITALAPTLADKVISGFAGGAAYGAVQPSDTLEGHLKNSVVTGLAGGALPIAGAVAKTGLAAGGNIAGHVLKTAGVPYADKIFGTISALSGKGEGPAILSKIKDAVANKISTLSPAKQDLIESLSKSASSSPKTGIVGQVTNILSDSDD